jgi:ElaB/YqjD/DUF883 family membrane-anchored ribosome-binding protein
MSSPETSSRSSGKKSKSPDEMADQLDELQSTVHNLASGLSGAANKQIKTAQQSLETSIRQNPISAVCIAAAAGFLYAVVRR